jgi:MoxR-like ATPase
MKTPTPNSHFQLLDPAQVAPQERRVLLARREIPVALSDHAEAARYFQPSADLAAAINVALAVGSPLLLTGEPGTGKTQVAHYLSWYFGVPLFPLDVRSTTTANDLLYDFDSVAYFHAASDPRRPGGTLAREDFIRKGPLCRALELGGPSVVLIDEIDKASRDFPNDLLGALDQYSFQIPGLDRPIERKRGVAPPIIVITSNSERRLPDPFLRRCVFYHIHFSEEVIRRAVRARRGDFSALDDVALEAALVRFMQLRAHEIRKKPATAELLVWLTLLAIQGVQREQIEQAAWTDLPGIMLLIKDRDDLAELV